jgi:hypothetical protein
MKQTVQNLFASLMFLTISSFALAEPSFDCPDLKSWHFVHELEGNREYGQTHTEMFVVNDTPTSEWVLKIRLPAAQPFITKYKSAPYWPSKFDMASFTWRYVYENAQLIIDSLLDSAELTSKEENPDVRVCNFIAHYGGNEVAMVAWKAK